jgi:3'-phosphoadenosine 5'-phosphosulfate sulfotransferase (PAPS reductase)/FAD synthetase
MITGNLLTHLNMELKPDYNSDLVIHSYDRYIVYFSGGKDSIACFLQLLEMGVPRDKIELWHHNIDGEEEKFMDWPITPAYCKAFADAFGVKIYFSWKEGGFKGEMLRENSLTRPTTFETPEGRKTIGGIRGKLSTRLKFPQVSVDLMVRWCSAYLKIDIGASALINQPRFIGIRTVVISGERGEESTARANYEFFEPDRADNRNGRKPRHVDRLRLVKDWTEKQVWDLIRKYKVRVHPCYYMGWGRCSCLFCIFGSKDQFASAFKINPAGGANISMYEDSFGTTIKRNKSIAELVAEGNAYPHITKELAELAMSSVYDRAVIMPKEEEWLLPAGAYGESCGPT